jgi:hypothetical protein
MGEVAIRCLAARGAYYSPFVRHVKHFSSLSFRLSLRPSAALETLLGQQHLSDFPRIYWGFHQKG